MEHEIKVESPLVAVMREELIEEIEDEQTVREIEEIDKSISAGPDDEILSPKAELGDQDEHEKKCDTNQRQDASLDQYYDDENKNPVEVAENKVAKENAAKESFDKTAEDKDAGLLRRSFLHILLNILSHFFS